MPLLGVGARFPYVLGDQNSKQCRGGSQHSTACGCGRASSCGSIVHNREQWHTFAGTSAILRCGFAITSVAATPYTNVEICPERALTYQPRAERSGVSRGAPPWVIERKTPSALKGNAVNDFESRIAEYTRSQALPGNAMQRRLRLAQCRRSL